MLGADGCDLVVGQFAVTVGVEGFHRGLACVEVLPERVGRLPGAVPLESHAGVGFMTWFPEIFLAMLSP